MRNCWDGLNESSAPSSTRPGSVRQANGVDVGVNVSVGVGLGVCEAVGGMGGEVGIGGFAGKQAVMAARSVSSVASSFVAWRVFIPNIIHIDKIKRLPPESCRKGIQHLNFEEYLRYNSGSQSGRGAVRLARLLWEQEVGGSNPLAPTYRQHHHFLHKQQQIWWCFYVY